jgi:hypothetical protein
MNPRNVLFACIAAVASNVHSASEGEFVEFHNASECQSNIGNSKSGIEIRTQDILNRASGIASLHCPISLSRGKADGAISRIHVSVSAYQHNIPSFQHMKCALKLHNKRDGSVFARFSDKIFWNDAHTPLGLILQNISPKNLGAASLVCDLPPTNSQQYAKFYNYVVTYN